MQETGPSIYCPYPKRLERLTICRYNYIDSTFSSVILRPSFALSFVHSFVCSFARSFVPSLACPALVCSLSVRPFNNKLSFTDSYERVNIKQSKKVIQFFSRTEEQIFTWTIQWHNPFNCANRTFGKYGSLEYFKCIPEKNIYCSSFLFVLKEATM